MMWFSFFQATAILSKMNDMSKCIALSKAMTMTFESYPWKINQFGGTINGNVCAKFENDPSMILPEASFGLRVLSLPARVYV